MKKLGLLVVIAAIVMTFAVAAYADCGCNKCSTPCSPCAKPCQPCVTCGAPCGPLQSMYDWFASWQMPCAPCAQPCQKPACSSCSK